MMDANSTNASTPIIDIINEYGIFNSILDKSQMAMTVVGFFANVATLITLMTHGQDFGKTIAFLLKHQSAVDAVVCLFAGILLASPPLWVPGISGLDAVICHLWNGQALYWVATFISVYNVVLIAYERFLCVCRPFKYQDFTRGSVICLISLVYVLAFICNCGSFVQTRMRENKCKSEYLWDGPEAKIFFAVFAISIFINYYVIPCSFFVGFYGSIIWTFRKRQQAQNLGASGASQVIDRATTELTKTAIVVTIIFIIALGYDCWYYLLGYLGVIEYILNSPVQKIGVWLAVFNSFANPFVYALFMPMYRKAVFNTFCTRCRQGNPSNK